ncbi:hypothetical protein SpCBS45565_g00119 [Spizellomyces sp. 'palustris']|nr:hypothetical protein SpCBS45565_g00119 [Spizellomyces sp. 'palustris']
MLGTLSSSSVTLNAACPKKLVDAEMKCNTDFLTEDYRLTREMNTTYPSAAHDNAFKTLATCACKAFAEYPTYEPLRQYGDYCTDFWWGPARVPFYSDFKKGCAGDAYNDVLVALNFTYYVHEGKSVTRLKPPFKNAQGNLEGGSRSSGSGSSGSGKLNLIDAYFTVTSDSSVYLTEECGSTANADENGDMDAAI